MERNKTIKIGMVLLIAAMLMSCGSNKVADGSNEEASRTTGTVTNTAQKAYAFCNKGSDTTGRLQAHVSAHLNSSGSIDPNFVHMKITMIPEGYTQNDKYIAVWKWYAESNGYSYVNSDPVAFKLVDIESGASLSDYMTQLQWSQVSGVASSKYSVSTAAELFKRVRFMVDLKDPNAQYDALIISYHDRTSGKSEIRLDMLLPVFDADPRGYQTESTGQARAMILQTLHPFYSQDYSLWSPTTFANKANEFCTTITRVQ